MLENYFGLIEGVFVFGLAVAFYVWQTRSVNRAIAERQRREAEAEKKDADG